MVKLSTIHIKAPHEVHIGAKVRAAQQGISMNQYVVNLIRSDLGEEVLENTIVGIKLYRGASPTEKKTLLKASKIIDKMDITPSQKESQEVIDVNSPRVNKIDIPIDKIKYSRKLCKHGNPKGSCMHKEAHRLKCNV